MADVAASPAPSEQDVGLPALKRDVLAYLYAPHGPAIDAKLADVEKQSGLKREHMAGGIGAVVALYLVIGSAAQLLCNCIGFAAPAFQSVKAIRSDRKDDDTQWLTYWTVFGVFACADFFAEGIMATFPIYYLAKVTFLLYLYLPQTQGAQKLYKSVIDPLVTRIDAYMGQAAANEKKAE